jgi:hypothetical protein
MEYQMTRMLTIAGAVALSAAMMYGTAYAAHPIDYELSPPAAAQYQMPTYPVGADALESGARGQSAYTYDRWGDYVPVWAADRLSPQ